MHNVLGYHLLLFPDTLAGSWIKSETVRNLSGIHLELLLLQTLASCLLTYFEIVPISYDIENSIWAGVMSQLANPPS